MPKQTRLNPDFQHLRRLVDVARKTTGRRIETGEEYQQAVRDGLIAGPEDALSIYTFSMRVDGAPSWAPLLSEGGGN